MTARAFPFRGMLAAVVAAWAIAGCERGAALPPGTALERVETWQVGVATAPDPPRTGDNTLTVVVRDSAGRPMRGTVDVLVSMPAMGAMPYMESRGRIESAGAGRFRARYGLPMQGEWDAVVRLRPDGGAPAEARYRISTSMRGVAFAGGVGPGTAMTVAPSAADSAAGVVTIDAARRQALGVRVAPVAVRELASVLRVPGRAAFDEARQAEVSPKYGGWVRTLAASVTGRPVRRGQVLATVYSPELWSAEQEYLEALKAARADRGRQATRGSSDELAEAARQRLLLWDVAPADVAALVANGRPHVGVPMRAPVSGVLTAKNVVAGSSFMPGQVLFRIARIDPVWVIASVPQNELGRVRPGSRAVLHDPDPARPVQSGTVQFVYPSVDSMTRAAEVRITAPNPGGRLVPGAFLDVELVTRPDRALAVPEEAVLPTGTRQLVFVDLGDGRLAPREVTLGRHVPGWYEVLRGLSAGERVVVSGNFLVAAEARLRSAETKW